MHHKGSQHKLAWQIDSQIEPEGYVNEHPKLPQPLVVILEPSIGFV